MEVIDDNNDDVDIQNPDSLSSVFSKGCTAKMVVQGSVYIVGQGFGVTWKPTYVQLSRRSKKSARDMFVEDEDDTEVAEKVDGGAVKAFEDDTETPVPSDANTYEHTPAVVVSPAPAPAPARRRKVA
jgi:hypothetical protein